MKITSSEANDILGRSGKGLITSLGLKTVRRSKKKKTGRYAITVVGLKDISKVIKEFEDFPYYGYVRKRSKYELMDSYFYLERHIYKCMMRLNMRVGPVRTQITNTQKMNNSETGV